MRLRDRAEPALDHGFAEILRHQMFHHVTGDLAGEPVAHHTGRDLALAEARYARLFGVLPYQRFLLLGHHVGGDFDADLALAGRVHWRRPFSMRVVMALVGVVVVLFRVGPSLAFSR